MSARSSEGPLSTGFHHNGARSELADAVAGLTAAKLISVLALGPLALPAPGLRLASDSAKSLPTSIAERQTLDRLNAAYPSRDTESDIVGHEACMDSTRPER